MGTVEVRRWTRQEYDRMVEATVFPPEERVELIDGEIFNLAPQGSAHMTSISLTQQALMSAFGTGYLIRIQGPVAVDLLSEPEPDIAVVPGSPRDYRDAHPSSAVLVVEVADATLGYDRERKGSLYARAGVADYWIVNLLDRRLEVYREPVKSSTARCGWEYRLVNHYGPGEEIAPLAVPEARIAVDDLLP